jgi:hypothetical protein
MDSNTVRAALESALASPVLVATAVGFLSHVGFWIHGLKDPYATQILVAHLAAHAALSVQTVSGHGLVQGLLTSTAISASYLGALFTSIIVYRLFFHRLRKFPGPFAAKFSKLYAPWLARQGRLHIRHLELTQKYGDFVRTGKAFSFSPCFFFFFLPFSFSFLWLVNNKALSHLRPTCVDNANQILSAVKGPNELVLLRTDAIDKVHGANSKCTKRGTRADNFTYHGVRNLDSMVDRDEHRWRRQVWDKAFGTKGEWHGRHSL